MCRDLDRVRGNRGRARRCIERMPAKTRTRNASSSSLRVSEAAQRTSRMSGSCRISCCFGSKPSFIKCDALAIDESFHDAALHGTGTAAKKSRYRRSRRLPGRPQECPDTNPTHDLVAISRRAHAVLGDASGRRGCRAARFMHARIQAGDARQGLRGWNGAASSTSKSGRACRPRKYKAECANASRCTTS